MYLPMVAEGLPSGSSALKSVQNSLVMTSSKVLNVQLWSVLLDLGHHGASTQISSVHEDGRMDPTYSQPRGTLEAKKYAVQKVPPKDAKQNRQHGFKPSRGKSPNSFSCFTHRSSRLLRRLQIRHGKMNAASGRRRTRCSPWRRVSSNTERCTGESAECLGGSSYMPGLHVRLA